MQYIANLIKKLWNIKIVRFFSVAGLNTIFGFSFYSFLIWTGLHFAVAILIGQIVGVLFNFKTYSSLVFDNKNNKLIFKFIAVYAFLWVFNTLGVASLKHLFEVNDYIAGAILVIPVGLLGFFINKTFVFKKSNLH